MILGGESMKTKRKIALALAGIGCIALIYVLVVFNGNPISHYRANQQAALYLEEHHLTEKYNVDMVSYDYKSGQYIAYIESTKHSDYNFEIYFNGLGRFSHVFESVYSNIESRLNELLREASQQLKTDWDEDCEVFLLSIATNQPVEYVAEMEFDLTDLPVQLMLYYDHIGENKSEEEFERLFIKLDEYVTSKGMSISSYNMTIAKKEKGEYQYTDRCEVNNMTPKEIYSDDFLSTIKQKKEIYKFN